MIAGTRSDSYNDPDRIRDPDIGNADSNQAEQWHAHQGLDHPRLVGAIVYYSPWVMPGRSAFEGKRTRG